MTKVFVYIGGYAQVGKTSVTNELRSRGYNCFSTSEILYEMAEKMCDIFELPCFYENKNQFYGMPLDGRYELTSEKGRTWLILLAEKVLVPVFGRQVFAHTATQRAIDCDSDLVFIESFNNEENQLMIQYASNMTPKSNLHVKFNIRRNTEDPSADSRELLFGAMDLQNDKTIPELVDELLSHTVSL